MAKLPSEDLEKLWRAVIRLWSQEGFDHGMNKQEFYNMIDDVDTWADNNQASFNSALDPIAQALPIQAKTFVLMAVVAMRTGEEFARKVLGGLID